MAQRIQIRRDTAANWTSTDPVLAIGEMGYETDTNKFKFGDGVTVWSLLPYSIGSSPLTTKGDVFTYDTADARLGVGTDGQVLTADAAEATGLKWADATGGGGGSTGFGAWSYKNTTADADPGSGNFRLNNLTLNLVTEVYLDYVNSDGVDMQTVLTLLGVDDELYIQQQDDSTKAVLFTITSVTDATGYYRIGVTYQAEGSGGIFDNNKKCGFVQIAEPPEAADIPFTPYGDIAATNVQAAIQELDDEKVALAGDTMTGALDAQAGVKSDTITESTTDAGVTIDGGTLVAQDQLSIIPTPETDNPPWAIISECATTNLVTNPRAHTDTSGWTITGGTLTRDTSESLYGPASFKVVTTGDGSLEMTTGASITGGDSHNCSMYYKLTVGATSDTAAISPYTKYDVSGQLPSLLLGYPPHDENPDEWLRADVPTTSAVGDSTAKAGMAWTGAGHTFYVTCIQLEERPTADASSPDGTKSTRPTAYCDGSMGEGHSWNGTAHASTSSRTAGTHHINTMADQSSGSFVISTGGAITSPRTHFKVEHVPSLETAVGGDPELAQWPWAVTGALRTGLLDTGDPAALAYFGNGSDGTALYVKSAVKTQQAMIIDVPNITDGTGLAIFVPDDLATAQANGAKFLDFAAKSGASAYNFTVDQFSSGNGEWPYGTAISLNGGGKHSDSWDSSVSGGTTTANYTVGTSLATRASGAGFTTLGMKPGDTVQINGLLRSKTIDYVVDDDNVYVKEPFTGSGTHSFRVQANGPDQFKPGLLTLASADHDAIISGANRVTYISSVFNSSFGGQLRWKSEEAIGAAVSAGITDDTDGAYVRGRIRHSFTDIDIDDSTTETTIASGETFAAGRLRAGSILKYTLPCSWIADAATDTVNFRVKIGGVTVATSGAIEAEETSANAMHGELEVTIYVVSATSVRTNLKWVCTSQSLTSPTTSDYVHFEDNTAVDFESGPQALSITAQMGTALGHFTAHCSVLEVL